MDGELIAAVDAYADAIADRISAVKAREPTTPRIAAVNDADDKLNAVSAASGYSSATAANARRVHRWAEAAMDAL